MAKLTKPQAKAHAEAEALINCGRPLKDEEKKFILDHWQESATNINSIAGAFFTPRGLAQDFSLEVNGGKVIDLCAGIGCLGYYVEQKATSLVCVEANPEYVRVGKRILPEAQWINASIFDPSATALTGFDWAISNPPFGNIRADDYRGRYKGAAFELKTIEQASRMAGFGAFILPQNSTPFRYSGRQCYAEERAELVQRFEAQTGIEMQFNCGIDTSVHRNDWKGVSPLCEIVVCEFQREPTFGLFGFDGGRNA